MKYMKFLFKYTNFVAITWVCDILELMWRCTCGMSCEFVWLLDDHNLYEMKLLHQKLSVYQSLFKRIKFFSLNDSNHGDMFNLRLRYQSPFSPLLLRKGSSTHLLHCWILFLIEEFINWRELKIQWAEIELTNLPYCGVSSFLRTDC